MEITELPDCNIEVTYCDKDIRLHFTAKERNDIFDYILMLYLYFEDQGWKFSPTLDDLLYALETWKDEGLEDVKLQALNFYSSFVPWLEAFGKTPKEVIVTAEVKNKNQEEKALNLN